MQSSFQQFDIKLKMLVTITLSLCALGLLLLPGNLWEITEGMPILVSLSLGVILYVAALLNQTTIFIAYKPFFQNLIVLMVILGLGVLGFLYFQAGMLIDGILLSALVLGQLYLQASRKWNHGHKVVSFLLVYAILFAISASIVLSGWMTWYGYYLQETGRVAFGSLFIFGSLASLVAYYFAHGRHKLSTIFYKLTIIPWLAWSIYFFLMQRFSTILVVTGLIIMPLIATFISWDKFLLPHTDRDEHKILQIASVTEFLILIALITIEYNSQELSFTKYIFLRNDILILSHGFLFLVMVIIKGLSFYTLITVGFTTRLLNAPYSDAENAGREDAALLSLPVQIEFQKEQIETLAHQLEHEKKRTMQISLLVELSQQLETQLDQPVSAQLAVNTLQRAINCKHVAILEHELERRELFTIASAGTVFSPNHRQSASKGLLGRTLRLRKVQISNNSENDPKLIQLGSTTMKSAFAIPIMQHGHVRAILELGDDKTNSFTSHDIQLAELVTAELTRAWERSSYLQRLTNLIKAGVSLSPILDPQTTINEIATITREILQARFVFVTLSDQENKLSRSASSGNAPRLLNSLNQHSKNDTTIQAALNAHEVFRIRDVRNYRKASHIEIDHSGLRSLIAIPIRLHKLSIGAILAFGKQKENLFSESDEILASLLASLTESAIEATWMYQELRGTLNTTSQLYNLSVKILQAESLQQAAQHIVEVSYRVSNATVAGIVLFTKDQQIEAGIIIDKKGTRQGGQHPFELVQQAIESGCTVPVTSDQVSATICFPLQTDLRKYGALWLEVPRTQDFFTHHASKMEALANQSILTLERSILLFESQQQTQAIKAANEELESAYDQTLTSFTSILDARDSTTKGHSTRVSELACLLGAEMGLDAVAIKALERGSLLHDIGKIGISDMILHKIDKLSEKEWETIRTHPEIGARIVEDIPLLQESLPIIRYHQERWDGSGYPVGLKGKDIPLQARIFAVVDTFEALISNRPYRKRITVGEAMDYLREQAGVLFDPKVVSAFEEMWKRNEMGKLIS